MSIEHTLHETLRELGEAFNTFKEVNDERLNALENKVSFDSLQEEKIQRLQEVMDKTQSRLLHVQNTMHQRPNIESAGKAQDSQEMNHKNAFLSYICYGSEDALRRAEQKALNHVKDSEGGFFMPSAMVQALYSTLEEDSLFRRLPDMKEIKNSRGLDVILDDKGYPVVWGEEKLCAPSSEDQASTLKKKHIPLCTMSRRPKVTQTLLEEGAVNVEAWLMEETRLKMIDAENMALLYGNPENHEPEGIVFKAQRGEISKQEFEALPTKPEEADKLLFSMMNAIPTSFLRDAVWLGSKEVMHWARSIKTSQGYLFWMPTKLNEHPVLMGYKFEVSDLMDKGDKKKNVPLIFGSFKRGYQGIYREGVRIIRDPFTYKPHIELYTTANIGGAVKQAEAFSVLQHKS